MLPEAGKHMQGALQRLHLLKSQKTRLNILDDISGIIPAGRMTLLLGPPGSGKSTLLQALAGKLQKTDLKVCLSTCYVWLLCMACISHAENPGMRQPTPAHMHG